MPALIRALVAETLIRVAAGWHGCGHTPAGPIGLLAALIGRLRGLEVHVLDRVTTGQKPDLVKTLGATYHSGAMADLGFAPDIIIECTGVGQVISDCFRHLGAGGAICLTGLGSGGSASGVVADVASEIVLKNNVVVGSVNANKRHWYKAAQDLARADREWLARLVSRRACGPRTSRTPSSAPWTTSRWSWISRKVELTKPRRPRDRLLSRDQDLSGFVRWTVGTRRTRDPGGIRRGRRRCRRSRRRTPGP